MRTSNCFACKFTLPFKNDNASTAQRRLEMAGNMDSELFLKFIRYFPDYLSALSRTLLRFFDNLCRNSCIKETGISPLCNGVVNVSVLGNLTGQRNGLSWSFWETSHFSSGL